MNNNPFNNTNKDDELNNIELPKVNPNLNSNSSSNTNNQNETNQNNKPIIEIPQEYYDKLAEEQQAKREAEVQKEIARKENAEMTNNMNKTFFFAILNAIIIFVSLYLTVNKTMYAFLAIPALIIVLSIFSSLKDKKESQYSASVIVGGVIVAVITFIISIAKEQEMDLWTYYAIAGVAIGFIGLILSTIINKIIVSPKEVTGVQGLGYIIFFIALIGGPIYLSKNYREEFYKLVFHTQVEVEAETEDDFVLKTLKARYNMDFTCDLKSVKNEYNEDIRRRGTTRTCQDKNNTQFSVKTIAYNEGSRQYIVVDDYLNVLYLSDTKLSLTEKIRNVTNASEVRLYMYPKENCFFYGDCHDCEEYIESYSTIYNIDNQYKTSSQSNFSKYLNQDSKSFINTNEFKYIAEIVGTYNELTDYNAIIESTLSSLNQLGYQNNFGYIITIYNKDTGGSETQTKVYEVKGSASSDKTFKDPVEVDIKPKH